MKAIQAFFKGWSLVIRYKRMWVLLYLLNFVLAVLSTISLSGFLGKTVGSSLSLGRSLPGFDYAFLGELNNEFGEQIRTLFNQSLLFVLVFFIISIFFIGGVLYLFKKENERFTRKAFWKGCSKYFWRLLRLTIYFLVIHGAILFLFFSIFLSMTSGLSPFEMENEGDLMNAAIAVGPAYLIFFTLISMVQDYAKIHLVHQNPTILFKTFWSSFKLVFQNFGRFTFLYLINILTLLICFGVYWITKDIFTGNSTIGVFLLFIIGQLFIIARVGIKLANLSSATYLYKWTRKN